MIGAGVFDRHPKLQVEKVAANVRTPSGYFHTNIFVDSFGFSALMLRAAIEMCGIDRVLSGTAFGPLPYGVRERVEIVAATALNQEDREKIYWRNSDALFGLELEALALSAALREFLLDALRAYAK